MRATGAAIVARLLLIAMLGFIGGCSRGARAIDVATEGEPALQEIAAAYAARVDELRGDGDTNWRSGWAGNALVHLLGRGNRGLCHEWQREVYDGVLARARSLGWEATAIVVERGGWGEHHAVLVHDPARVEMAIPRIHAPGGPAYVLDPWRRGEADVFRFSDWIRGHLGDDPPFEIKRIGRAAAGRDAG